MELSFFLIAVVWQSVPLGYRAEIRTLDLPCDSQAALSTKLRFTPKMMLDVKTLLRKEKF